ncbi:aspartate/glutamate racemase family protein [Desulfopila sp. IMCC35006]|uniref:aspartate/glutamate racemase family protein n=1 Tax=Desulfopila sp. IMCC35006 TaxID=2569542 RepID=UPI0010AD81F6|nr:aspartate/glutamate racemase family protein [Desulfopila sp. IMCC35006]TKB27079.1 aspartate/glutamate racemase family protein [Desulfopila sp. IMCC35006]
MKTIGLLGGMSWESTAHYYRMLNQGINDRLGGLHSAQIAMVSVDFQPLETLMQKGDWTEVGKRLADAAQKIAKAGADFLLICTNTMHKVAPTITDSVEIPLLHIADATAEKIKAAKLHTVGLLGTAFTMEEEFYQGRLSNYHGLEVIVPSSKDRSRVHDIIFDELCRGKIRDESRKTYLRIIETMRSQGAEAVIEGCTEISMLVNQDHTTVPLFDTTALHVEQAVSFALSD